MARYSSVQNLRPTKRLAGGEESKVKGHVERPWNVVCTDAGLQVVTEECWVRGHLIHNQNYDGLVGASVGNPRQRAVYIRPGAEG